MPPILGMKKALSFLNNAFFTVFGFVEKVLLSSVTVRKFCICKGFKLVLYDYSPNGEGSIRKRTDGRWLVTFPTGLYKENGKREYVYRYADTQAEATEILRQLQAEKGMGVSQSKAAIKAGEWMNTWIEKHKSPKLAPATLTSYRNNFRIHIRPYIGDIVLRELSTYHIQR